MNKKASIFFWPYLLLILLVLTSYGMYSIFTRDKTINGIFYVGGNQQRISDSYALFESKNLFFEKASLLSYYDSVYYLYENGGKFNFDCGQEQGYILWKIGSVDCFVDKKGFSDSFEKVFSSNLGIYTKDYINFPISGNLDFIYDENLIYIKTKTKLKMSKDNVEYQDYLYSNIVENLPMDEVLQITTEAKNYIKECREDISCYKTKSQDSLFSWSIKNNGKLFMFDVNTNKKIGLFEKKDLILRFGVDFKELNPLFG